MLLSDFSLADFSKKKKLKCNRPVRAPAGSKKKWKVRVCRKGKEKTLQYGQRGYQDYTQHKDPKRRKKFLARSAGIRNKQGKLTKDDPFSANYWNRRKTW